MHQVSFEENQKIENITKVVEWAAGATFIAFILMMFSSGPLLPPLMFLNSMQLLFHLPLIKSDMPAQTHYFMVGFL